MATTDELTAFVREALARGTSRAQVEEVLRATGWNRDQVSAALDAYADVEFPIPVPRPKPYLSAREAFMYLLLFSMLYVSAFNLGVLLFEFINRAFPDAAVGGYEEYARQSVRWALASVIVSFPVFIYLSALVERAIRHDPGKRRSNVRRWLMYLTIFAAACVLIGDFITLVYNTLGGEWTPRFVLKVAAIALIAGTILGYYLSDLKLEDTKPVTDGGRSRRAIAGFAILAAVAAAAAGLVAIGSPSDERSRRLDARRVEDLRAISQSINVYWTREKQLPSSLTDLTKAGLANQITDARYAEVGPYEYRVTGAGSYELCATFERVSTRESRSMSGEFWSHGPGRRCFALDAKEIR